MTRIVTTYKQFRRLTNPRGGPRDFARNAAVRLLAMTRARSRQSAIRFLYYHHVFDDERYCFEKQLRHLRGSGEFVSLDESIALLASREPLDGKYFCITFDDGFKNCLTNAVPILGGLEVPATFFLAVDYIGPPNPPLTRSFFKRDVNVEFLDWPDVRAIAESQKMSIGSHSCSHTSLSELTVPDVERELAVSKEMIERETGRACRHFCAPRGKPVTHFEPTRDPSLAAALGYQSFHTTVRGAMSPGDSIFSVKRDHVIAAWATHQLDYFLSS